MAEKLLAVQRILSLVLLGVVVARATVVRYPQRGPRPPAPLVSYSNLLIVAFALLAAAHGFWAFVAQESEGFRGVGSHDPRAWHLASVSDRRNVVDRRGQLLIGVEQSGRRVVRTYPLGPGAAHLTGYYDKTYGHTGLEAACDDRLSTWRPSALQALRLDEGPDEAGRYRPLALTVDVRLQRAAAAALRGRAGAVVALNPVAGDVLALVSAPSFDPAGIANSFGYLEAHPDSPLLNRALAGLYPPGSTFKPVTAGAALAAGLPVETTFESGPNGFLAPGDTQAVKDFEATLRDDWSGHGTIDMHQAMVRSANTYFAWLAVEVGQDALLHAARSFGLDRAWNLVPGRRTVDLRSLPGRLPAAKLKPGDVARCGIGQSDLLVTPLGMAVMAATIANYGTQVPPRLLLDDPPAMGRQALSPELATVLQSMMRDVVADRQGTGHGLRLSGVATAGKTGSAENPHGRPHSWVIAFAPVEGASVAVAAVVENGGWGGEVAAPVVRAVLEAARDAGYFAGEP